MSEPTIAGEPLADWEGIMQAFDDACARDGLEFRGLVAHWQPHDRWNWVGRPGVMADDPWLGINPDGTRKTIAQYRAERGMA